MASKNAFKNYKSRLFVNNDYETNTIGISFSSIF